MDRPPESSDRPGTRQNRRVQRGGTEDNPSRSELLPDVLLATGGRCWALITHEAFPFSIILKMQMMNNNNNIMEERQV